MVPMEIGQLLFLQTLDLEGLDFIKELPASVFRLRNLMYLYLDCETHLPVGYGKLTSLRELARPLFTEDDDPEEMRYLTELRKLEFIVPVDYTPGKLLILLESVGKLHKLQMLSIKSHCRRWKIDNLGDWAPSLPQLRVLVLKGWYHTMPTWITSSLHLICYLDICVHHVRLEDIQVLGTLPALYSIVLDSDVDPAIEEGCAEERLVMLSPDAFPRVIECSFQYVLLSPYMFPRGAMPMVQVLSFGVMASDILSDGDWDLCLRNLPSLKDVHIYLYGEKRSSERHKEARASVERAGANHPNRPRTGAF
jgi:hypothetical protein